MRYRPSAMGFESQLKSGGEESVPNCTHSQWRAWASAAVYEQGRGGGARVNEAAQDLPGSRMERHMVTHKLCVEAYGEQHQEPRKPCGDSEIIL